MAAENVERHDVFFARLAGERCRQVRFNCSDPWKPWLAVIARRLPLALHLPNRFHIRQNLSKAI